MKKKSTLLPRAALLSPLPLLPFFIAGCPAPEVAKEPHAPPPPHNPPHPYEAPHIYREDPPMPPMVLPPMPTDGGAIIYPRIVDPLPPDAGVVMYPRMVDPTVDPAKLSPMPAPPSPFKSWDEFRLYCKDTKKANEALLKKYPKATPAVLPKECDATESEKQKTPPPPPHVAPPPPHNPPPPHFAPHPPHSPPPPMPPHPVPPMVVPYDTAPHPPPPMVPPMTPPTPIGKPKNSGK